MAAVPVVKGSKVVSALEKHDFVVDRINGSHHIMKHPDGRGTTVPVHAGKDVPKGTLRNILTDVGMTPDELFNPKKKASGRAAAVQQVVDPREGVADARGAVGSKGSTARSGARRGSGSAGRERDGRTR